MRVLVVGAGFVGMALAEALDEAGHVVFATRRRTTGERARGGVTMVPVDFTDPASLRALPEGIDQVYFTVAPDESTGASYEAVYVRGPEAVLQAGPLRERPPGRVVFTSSTSVYGQTDGSWVDESSPTEPTRFSGRLMLQAERTLREAAPSVVAVRCSGIYGPGRGRLIERIRNGEAQYTEGSYTNRIHRDDVVSALIHVARLDEPEPIYVGSDEDPALQQAVYRWLAERLDAPPPEPARGTARPGRGTNKRCHAAALGASAFSFRYPSFRDGYDEILRSMATR